MRNEALGCVLEVANWAAPLMALLEPGIARRRQPNERTQTAWKQILVMEFTCWSNGAS
jgi:hypothetical protein